MRANTKSSITLRPGDLGMVLALQSHELDELDHLAGEGLPE
jgi:hypothetical protein